MDDLSVIVCTRDRPLDLARCLEGLVRLHDQLEVIVVDSASRTPCEPLVDRFRALLAPLRYVYVDEAGLSHARNAGVAIAGGSIIAFIDDDAVPCPGWAAAIRAAFRPPEIGCVGGACRPRFTAPRPRWLSDRLLQLAGITRFGARAREPSSSAEWPFGANMAFRRAALEHAGGFSRTLGRDGRSLLSGEDSDMVGRVLGCGWRAWLEPAAVVEHTVHEERCHSSYYWRRLWWNGISRARQPSVRASFRLIAAVPLRLLLWAAVRDRLYLYRVAESAGYFAARLGLARA